MSTAVLVVGGTGALGAPTTQRREDGYRVRLVVRDPKRLPRHSDDVEYVTGDLENPTPSAAHSAAAGPFT
jgi:uncharacterized protein YbjT (DUF2867 family)